MTALHIAVKHGSVNVSLLLIERLKRENLITIDKNKMLVLHHLAKCKIERINVMEKLLSKYNELLDMNYFNEILNMKDKFDNTILHLAVRENHINMVELLIKTNSNFKMIGDHDNNLPIHINAINGSVEVLEIFDKYNFISFEVNKSWNNVFHLATYGNKYKYIVTLMSLCEKKSYLSQDLKFALNAYNKEAMTPFLLGISRGSIECIDLYIKNHKKLITPYMDMFKICIEHNQIETLRYLLNLNENIIDEYSSVKSDFTNNSLLHLACIHKNFKIFKILIEYINDGKLPIDMIERRNQKNESCFFIACKNGCLEIVEYLVNLYRSKKFPNYDPMSDKDDENSTPLHLAARTNHSHILEVLIENGADVNSLDKFSRSPIHYSCQIGSFEITKILVDHKSKLNINDTSGKYR